MARTSTLALALLLASADICASFENSSSLRGSLASNATQTLHDNISEVSNSSIEDASLDAASGTAADAGQLVDERAVANLAEVRGSWSYVCYTMPWLPYCGTPAHGGYDPQSQHSLQDGAVLTLYHATSPEAGASILKTGFRPGHVGYCGGGIYFATSPAATLGKAVGPDSHQGFMLEARVDLGRIKHDRNPSCTSSQLGIYHLDRHPLSKYLNDWGCDSVTFNPGDGVEYAIADPSRVLSVKHYAGYQYR